MRDHRYVAVLGSPCTGDIFLKEGETFSRTRLRLVLFQGRTSFPSMVSPGLQPEEYALAGGAGATPRMQWCLRMLRDEIDKAHVKRLRGAAKLIDGLVIDNISAFEFPHAMTAEQRVFLRSNDWATNVTARVKLKERYLWECEIGLSVAALSQFLDSMLELNPSLAILFHCPRPMFNDGITFDDERVTGNVDFYREYCDRLYEAAVSRCPKVAVLPQRAAILADPSHSNGANPFHFEETYSTGARLDVERILGLPAAA